MRRTIVIADNDPETVHALVSYMPAEPFDAVFVDCGRDAKREVERRNPALVVLSTGFSDIPGLELVRWMLARPVRVGLILLSARADPIDRTIGLEMGADDYVSKPFFARELLARVHSVLRRLQPVPDGDAPAIAPRSDLLTVRGYVINLLSRHVVLPGGGEVTLSWTEAKVLSVLLDQRGVPVTRDVLSQKALGRPWLPDDRALDQHVVSLRRKLDGPGADRPLIATVRHVGYVIESGG